MPYQLFFNMVRARLTEAEFNGIIDEINRRIDAAGGQIATAGWIPGGDWSGTPFECIYSKGCHQNYELSARFFGLCVWYAIMNRPERWASGRYQLDEKDIGSRTYFRIGEL